MERDLEKYFNKKVKEMGGKSIKLVPTFCNGLPDRLVIYGGRVFFVELKSEKGILSEIQKFRHKEFAKYGIEVQTLYGKSMCDKFLSEIRVADPSIYDLRVRDGF